MDDTSLLHFLASVQPQVITLLLTLSKIIMLPSKLNEHNYAQCNAVGLTALYFIVKNVLLCCNCKLHPSRAIYFETRRCNIMSCSYPMDTWGSFPEVKRPGREADYSPPSRAEDKNAWSYTSTPPIRLHGVVLS
jgi:hypothetical protein